MLKIAYQLGQERALAEVGLMVKHAGIPASALEHMLLGGALGSGVGAIGGGEGNRGRGAIIGGLTGAGTGVGGSLGGAIPGKLPLDLLGVAGGGVGGYYGGKALAPEHRGRIGRGFDALKAKLQGALD